MAYFWHILTTREKFKLQTMPRTYMTNQTPPITAQILQQLSQDKKGEFKESEMMLHVKKQIEKIITIYNATRISQQSDAYRMINVRWFYNSGESLEARGEMIFEDRVISMVRRGLPQKLRIPVQLLNSDEHEIRNWVINYLQQMEIHDQIHRLKLEHLGIQQSVGQLQQCITHTQDPEWMKKKIQKISIKIQQLNKISSQIQDEILKLATKLPKENQISICVEENHQTLNNNDEAEYNEPSITKLCDFSLK